MNNLLGITHKIPSRPNTKLPQFSMSMSLFLFFFFLLNMSISHSKINYNLLFFHLICIDNTNSLTTIIRSFLKLSITKPFLGKLALFKPQAALLSVTSKLWFAWYGLHVLLYFTGHCNFQFCNVAHNYPHHVIIRFMLSQIQACHLALWICDDALEWHPC